MRKYYRDFSGGMIDKIEPELIPDNAVVKAINCEYVKSGVLTKRRGTMPSDLQSGLANQGLLNPRDFWVWYPKTMPTVSIGSVVYVVYTNDYRICVLWKTSETLWSHQETDFTYTEDSEIEIFAGADSFLITDNVNIAHRIVIDSDGTILSGYLEIPAPPEAPILRPMEDWDANRFETDSSGEKVGDCGLVQCVVTVVTEYGEESNPSPISKTLDMQWLKIDTDNIDEQWLDKVYTDNLTIPEGIDEYTRSKLKDFKIYYRIFRYSDLESQPFTLGATIEITDKTAGAKNTHTLTNEIGEGEYPSYENDSAPIGKVICETADVKFIGGVKTNLKFPHSDLKYCKLNIQNPDSRSYVDAVIWIRLYDMYAPVTENKKISNFNWEWNPYNRIRLYDKDLTTAIKVVYNYYSSGDHYLDVFVKIPLFTGGINNPVYFCFGDNVLNNDDGGQFTSLTDWQFPNQETFQGEKVKYKTVVCCPANEKGTSIGGTTDSVITNKANINYTGTFNSKVSWSDMVISGIPEIRKFFNWSCLKFNTDGETFGKVTFADIGISSLPETGYIKLCAYININDIHTAQNIHLITFYTDASHYLGLVVNSYTGLKYIKYSSNGLTHYGSNSLRLYDYHSQCMTIVMSWDKPNEKVSLFAKMFDQPGGIYDPELPLKSREYTVNNLMTTISDIVLGDINGNNNATFYLSQIQVVQGRYLSANNYEDRLAAESMAHFFPAFETFVGGGSQNNIIFEETKENEIKERRNTYKWSELNGINFPDLFEKQVREPILKIIPTQSYLQFEYLPTVLIFTRNTVTRFIVSGLPEDWRQQSDKLIEEYSQYGLLAPKSLTKVGNSIFWFSEIGVIKWSKDGFRNISIEKIDIPIADTYIGFYTKRNQYILQQITPGLNYSYVYDITRNVWTKFYGLDVQVAQILAGGTESDNINLFLNSQGVIEAYPAESHYTLKETIITTKKYVFDNPKYRRFRMDFDGQCRSVVTIKNRDKEITQSFETVNRMKMHGLANGSWGDSIQFKINTVEKFKRLDLDILPRG